MLYKSTVLAGLASVASAHIFANPVVIARGIEARQTDAAGSSACASAGLSLITALPLPPADLINWVLQNPITDACDLSKIPASLSPAISSYQTVALSFISAHSSELSSIASACPDATSLLDGLDVATLTCGAGSTGTGVTTATSGAGGSGATPTSGAGGSGTTGTTGSAGGAGSASSTSKSTAGAARETGFVAAAVAAAGFLGAVAAL